MTTIDRTTGVSRFVRRPRSWSIFATTPDEVTQVIPARAMAPTGPHPSMSATSAPGTALSSMSINARHARSAEAADQLGGAVFDPEQQQEEDDADLGADLDELRALRDGQQAALAERETADQDERDRRDPEACRKAGEEPDAEDERADFDEDEGAVVHRDQPR